MKTGRISRMDGLIRTAKIADCCYCHGPRSYWRALVSDVVMRDAKSGSRSEFLGSGRSKVPLKNLNPVAAKDHLEFLELRMIYDRLFRISPEGKPGPWAAESYKIVNPTMYYSSL